MRDRTRNLTNLRILGARAPRTCDALAAGISLHAATSRAPACKRACGDCVRGPDRPTARGCKGPAREPEEIAFLSVSYERGEQNRGDLSWVVNTIVLHG